MRLLFLVWSNFPPERIYADPSVFYRCFHPAEALRAQGILVSVLHRDAVELDELKEYDVIIFFRPQFSSHFLELFYAAEDSNIQCIASYDDLFFDIRLLRQSNFRGLGAPQTQILGSRPYGFAQAMYFFDHFIASTDFLGQKLITGTDAKTVHVQYNAISSEMLSLAKLCTQRTERVNNRIGYFAGGASHGPDLKDISGQLAEAIVERDAEFFCVETVDVPQVIRDTGRVVTTPRLSYVGMLRAYASCAVTIAPLHMNEFTSSKSGIKYLEASIVGAATVATPIPDVMRIANERLIPVPNLAGWKTGILAGLDLPVNDEITKAQQERIEVEFSTRIEGKRLLAFLEGLSSKTSELPSGKATTKPKRRVQTTVAKPVKARQNTKRTTKARKL